MRIENCCAFGQDVDDLFAKDESRVIQDIGRLDIVFGDCKLFPRVVGQLRKCEEWCSPRYLYLSLAQCFVKPSILRTLTLNIIIESSTTCAKNSARIVPRLQSSHGILKPGSEKRKTPSIATHFSQSQKGSLSPKVNV